MLGKTMAKFLVAASLFCFVYLLSLGTEEEWVWSGNQACHLDESQKNLLKSLEGDIKHMAELKSFLSKLLNLHSTGDLTDKVEVQKAYCDIDQVIENRLNQFVEQGSTDKFVLWEINLLKTAYKFVFGKEWIPLRLRTVSTEVCNLHSSLYNVRSVRVVCSPAIRNCPKLIIFYIKIGRGNQFWDMCGGISNIFNLDLQLLSNKH